MGSFSIWHWLIVLVIILLVFGTKKLPNIGKDVGNAIKGFREGVKEAENEQNQQNQTLLSENQNPQNMQQNVQNAQNVNQTQKTDNV